MNLASCIHITYTMKTYGKRFELIKRALFPEEKAYDPNFLYTARFWVIQLYMVYPLPLPSLIWPYIKQFTKSRLSVLNRCLIQKAYTSRKKITHIVITTPESFFSARNGQFPNETT